jgi:hypothetical protein
MAVTGSRVTSIGVDHSGKPKPGTFAKPGEVGLSTAHTPAATTNMPSAAHPGNIARSGAPKAHVHTPFHSGMKEQQTDVAGLGGMGHSTTIDGGQVSDGVNPLAKAPLPKLTQQGEPVIHPGMRNQTKQTKAGATAAEIMRDADPSWIGHRGKVFNR